MGQVVIVVYKPKAGKAEALKSLLDTHVQRLLEQNLVTRRKPVLLTAGDGTFIEIFEWLSPEAIKQAHTNKEVQKMWGEFAEVCDYVPLNTLPEAGNLFAAFNSVD